MFIDEPISSEYSPGKHKLNDCEEKKHRLIPKSWISMREQCENQQ